ncbi:MAG: adenine-specific DNA-methyltransferase, partial [Verrucomicrobiota bacterium]|nr:adenine-specific DNA-methyltransferase [Verrucomicrobiota bacterium]
MPVFDDLKAKLQELFMFDRADLDFGMYRILNAKRAEVTRFLETELLPSARTALGSVTAEDQARLKVAVET